MKTSNLFKLFLFTLFLLFSHVFAVSNKFNYSTFIRNKYVEIGLNNIVRVWNLDTGKVYCKQHLKFKMYKGLYALPPFKSIVEPFDGYVVIMFENNDTEEVSLQIFDPNACQFVFTDKDVSAVYFWTTNSRLIYFDNEGDLKVLKFKPNNKFSVEKLHIDIPYKNLIPISIYDDKFIFINLDDEVYIFDIKNNNFKPVKAEDLWYANFASYAFEKTLYC